MTIRIDFIDELVAARVSASPDTAAHVWSAVRDALQFFDPGSRLAGRELVTEWRHFLNASSEISTIKRRTGEQFEYSEAAKARLLKYREELKRVDAARRRIPTVLSRAEIEERLAFTGFSKRRLMPYQVRDLSALIGLPNGANFSVPGAGKTTVALAVHLLTEEPGMSLLVVAPKNAFGAWDEVIEDCLIAGEKNSEGFVRLSGSGDSVREILTAATPPKRLIISYDQLIRSERFVRVFMQQHPIHLILDESHRIKGGALSQRGQAALTLGPLAVRRDILSGTPVPNGIADIVPQIDFLWPGQALGEKAARSEDPNEVLAPLYVRTTKRELGLGPVLKHYERVEMSRAQGALYAIARSELLKIETGIRRQSNVDLDSASRSVIRLLQISSNPLLVVKRLTNEAPDRHVYDNDAVRAIFASIFAEGDSPKIVRACEIARNLASRGERTVIWTTFTENVERIAELLRGLGATFIHGGVDTGSRDDPDSREGRISRFHDDSMECMVLVANPAACSEGISLHRACHHAVYVDRTFNAAHFLQSVDRIHRLGLPADVETHVYILESIAPQELGAIDYSVRRRMVDKLRIMAAALNDADLHELMLDEDSADLPIDIDIQIEDILDVINELKGLATAPAEEEV